MPIRLMTSIWSRRPTRARARILLAAALVTAIVTVGAVALLNRGDDPATTASAPSADPSPADLATPTHPDPELTRSTEPPPPTQPTPTTNPPTSTQPEPLVESPYTSSTE